MRLAAPCFCSCRRRLSLFPAYEKTSCSSGPAPLLGMSLRRFTRASGFLGSHWRVACGGPAPSPCRLPQCAGAGWWSAHYSVKYPWDSSLELN